MAAFTPERRERFLTLIETGRNVGDAASSVGVSRSAITKWVREGNAEGAHPDKAEFAKRYEAIRKGPSDVDALKLPDLIKLLEAKARRGDVPAIKLLIDRPWDKKAPQADAKPEDMAPVVSLMDRIAARRESA